MHPLKLRVMRSTFRILFYVNKQRAKDGRVPICVRLTVNGKSTFISLRLTISLALWDSAVNKATGKSAEARNVNAELERIRAKLLHHYQRISDRDAYVTAERVKLAYLGMGEEYETLLEAFDKFIRDFIQHVGVDRASPPIANTTTYVNGWPSFFPTNYIGRIFR